MDRRKIWVVEAHDLGALQVRPLEDAVKINRKKWMADGKADRLIVGAGETIEEALEEERELKRMKKEDDRQQTTARAERTGFPVEPGMTKEKKHE